LATAEKELEVDKMVTLIDYSITIVGAFLAMCMFTTLYGKSSPLYALAEESYIGFGTGLTIVINAEYIWRTGIVNIMAGDYILILALILGAMILFRVHPKYNYVARIPIAIALGAQFGLSLRTIIFTGFIQQIGATIVPLFTGTMMTILYRWTIALSVILMMTFFFYTIELSGPLATSSRIGEYVLYIAFGAIFAQTFMGRLGLFVGFMQSYTVPPWRTPILLAAMIIVFVAIVAMDRTGLLEKYTPVE
jgi:hypothetical protein